MRRSRYELYSHFRAQIHARSPRGWIPSLRVVWNKSVPDLGNAKAAACFAILEKLSVHLIRLQILSNCQNSRSTIFRDGEAIVRSWSATRTSVKCPYQCSAKYHNFETIPIALHSRKYGSCQTWNNFRPILVVFPGTNHELAKGVTHEFDRDRQEWRAVGVKEDNEKPSKDLNALVQAFGGMTLASRSPRPSSQWGTEPFQLSHLYSSLLKRAQMHNNYDGRDRTIGCLYRGPSYPIAVSGWKDSELTGQDGTVTRSRWTKKAMELAQLVLHELRPHKRDSSLQPGSYHACHVEKQLLAFLIWNHSTALGDV